MSYFSCFSGVCCCLKSRYAKAKEVVDGWEEKFERDIDFKPVMELIMR